MGKLNPNVPVMAENELNKEIHGLQYEIAKTYFDKLWMLNNKDAISTKHIHSCQFELEKKLGIGSKHPSLKCKRYLKTLGMKRDSCLSCCDKAGPKGCKYMKTIVWDSNGEILFIY